MSAAFYTVQIPTSMVLSSGKPYTLEAEVINNEVTIRSSFLDAIARTTRSNLTQVTKMADKIEDLLMWCDATGETIDVPSLGISVTKA